MERGEGADQNSGNSGRMIREQFCLEGRECECDGFNGAMEGGGDWAITWVIEDQNLL